MKAICSLILLLFVASCNLPAASTPGQVPATSAAPATGAPAGTQELPSHRVGVRLVDGTGEFYDRATGQKFVPRGMNYIRLGPQTLPDGSTQIYHSAFDPGRYDGQQAAAALARMHADGYNVARVFLSQNTMGTAGDGLSAAYMQNVADFLQQAKRNEMYVMFTQDWLPGGKYGEVMNRDCCERFNFNNAQNLPGAAVQAYQLYYKDFISALVEAGAPTDFIFSYELRNEFFYDRDYPPFSLNTGTVTTANGKTYDMSSADDKQSMAEENLVYFIDNVRQSILSADPTALVSIGFFQPQEPNPSRVGDERLVVTRPAIWDSQADFIDLHPYPGGELSLKQYVENFGLNDMKAKPVIMGEFGAPTSRYDLETAARRFVDWQVESCAYGFDGWLFWTWDANESPDFMNALMGDGQIEKALSPAARPDPCAMSLGGETNVALGKAAAASRALADQPPSKAVDDGFETTWGAGEGPQQWIEIDLGQPYTVSAVRLTVAQYPEGITVHQVWVRGPNDSLRLLHEFSGSTQDGQVLEFKPDAALAGIQYLRVVTVQSPSWVAWREIEVIGK